MKRIKKYYYAEDIPSNAVFLYCDPMDEESIRHTFYYEVPDKLERSTKTISAFKVEIDEIINFLNKEAGKSFHSKTEGTRKLIFRWLKIGYTVDQFKEAITNMVDAWLNDPKMNQYLRPSTLFGNKFEGYYNKGYEPTEEDIFSELDDIVVNRGNEDDRD